jgi:hypothetical protein
MTRKILLIGAFMMLLCISLKAQTLSPATISSGGGFYNAGGNTLSFTVAEMTMVQTFLQPSNMLTQGFQQPEQLTTSITETETGHNEVIVFPNPSNGRFNISYDVQSNRPCKINIYNLVGQILYTHAYETTYGPNLISIDISGFDQGIYYLEFIATHPDGMHKSSLHKINIVY